MRQCGWPQFEWQCPLAPTRCMADTSLSSATLVSPIMFILCISIIANSIECKRELIVVFMFRCAIFVSKSVQCRSHIISSKCLLVRDKKNLNVDKGLMLCAKISWDLFRLANIRKQKKNTLYKYTERICKRIIPVQTLYLVRSFSNGFWIKIKYHLGLNGDWQQHHNYFIWLILFNIISLIRFW